MKLLIALLFAISFCAQAGDKLYGAHLIRDAFHGGDSGSRQYHPAPIVAAAGGTIYIKKIKIYVHTGYFPPNIPVSGWISTQKDDPAGTGNSAGPYRDGIGVVYVHLAGGLSLVNEIDFGHGYLELGPNEKMLDEWSLVGVSYMPVWNPATSSWNTGTLDLHGVGIQPVVDIYWTLTP